MNIKTDIQHIQIIVNKFIKFASMELCKVIHTRDISYIFIIIIIMMLSATTVFLAFHSSYKQSTSIQPVYQLDIFTSYTSCYRMSL